MSHMTYTANITFLLALKQSISPPTNFESNTIDAEAARIE